MHNQVIADIEIEDKKIEHYSSVIIRQQFNAHHEFAIRIKYDVLEKIGSFSLSNAQKLIGKTAIIKLLQTNSLEAAYEFRGIICEIAMEHSDNFTSDFVLTGYSPTILMENGANLASFYKKGLQQIVHQISGPVADPGFEVKIAPQYKTPITYICQYRESSFHFMNRLSSDYGEWCYYDGQSLFFGKPSSSPNIDITYGEDVHNMQLKLKVLPMAFSSYAYVSKDDKLLTYDSPKNVDGLDEYAAYALKESNKIFSNTIQSPIRQRVETKSDLEGFVKKQKAAMAAELEVLTGSSDNPALCIGAIANIKVSVLQETSMAKEECGKYIITSIEHHLTDNDKYFNYFEALPSNTEVMPVKNIILPIAEPQIATVKDNKDPDNIGRVRVQMLWQQANDEMTDWLRVMTPDAGGGKDGAKNRGLVVVPEPDDQVLVCFRYNDPDRPFVLGSMFHGKTGGGGGDGNKTKSLTVLSGSTIVLKDKTISIIDADEKSKILMDGTGKIDVDSSESITLTSGDSSMTLKKDGTIEIKGKKITISGDTIEVNAQQEIKMSGSSSGVSVKGMKIELTADTDMKMKGLSTAVEATTEMKIKGLNTTAEGSVQLDLKGGAMASLSAALVKIN